MKSVYCAVRTGSLNKAACASSLMSASMKQGIVRMAHSSPRAEYAKNSKTSSCSAHDSAQKHCMQRVHHMHRVQHLGLGDFAEGWNFASGSMSVASCILTSCLLTKRNSIATVSIIHTTIICGQLRIPTPPWKATFNYVSVSVCGVQFRTVS